MTTLNKIFLGIIGALTLAFIVFFFYKEHQISAIQAQLNDSIVAQKTLTDNITRSSAQTVSQADLQAFAAQNKIDLDAIKADLQTLQASITGVNAVTVVSNPQVNNGAVSTNTSPNPNPPKPPTASCNGTQVPCPNADPFGFSQNIQTLNLNEQFAAPAPATTSTPSSTTPTVTSVPIGSVNFDSSKQDPWSYNIPQRKYNITNVIGTDANDKQYVYNKVSINTGGKDYPVPVSSAQFVEEVTPPSFSWWNPRLFLSVDGSVNVSEVPVKAGVSPAVHMQIASYGSSKVTPSISILQVGLGYEMVSKTPQVSLTPVAFNVGKIANLAPVINNTFVGPNVSLGTDKNVYIGAGIGIGF
jgi:hypothetical protein